PFGACRRLPLSLVRRRDVVAGAARGGASPRRRSRGCRARKLSVRFEVIGRSGRARRGQLWTPHGVVETPAFMPVGTLGSVKALHPSEVGDTGARMLIA